MIAKTKLGLGWTRAVSKNAFNYDNSAIILVKIIWQAPSCSHAHTDTTTSRRGVWVCVCVAVIFLASVRCLVVLCFCLTICILSSSWLFFIFVEHLPHTDRTHSQWQSHTHTVTPTLAHTNWICMKLMSSSLLRCPCTEFNLHSPKSHAVIWHVYQTEATQHRPTSAPPLALALPALVHLTVHLYSSSGRSSPHTATHSLCLSLSAALSLV